MKTSERLLRIVDLLSGPRRWKISELKEHLGVTERTIYRDLVRLENARVPVSRDELGYSLPRTCAVPVNLTREERALLATALGSSGLQGIPSLGKRSAKLLAKLAGTRSEAPTIQIGGPERIGFVEADVFEALERAIDKSHTVRIEYVSLSGRSRRWRSVDPWRLLHRDGAWYLAAWCHDNREPRFFRLDRIRGARPSGVQFIPPELSALSGLLDKSWSIFRGDELNRIVIHFSADFAPLLESSQHHEGERVRKLSSGEIEYAVELSHIDEIARWILGFGGAAKVIEPARLRDRVVEIAQGALSVHASRRGPKQARSSSPKVKRRSSD